MTRIGVPACMVLLLGCAGSQVPAQLRHYTIVVEQQDSESVELARALRERGIKVRPRVRGGSGPTAALIYFTYQDPSDSGAPTSFNLRLADTRSGVIIRAGSITLDTTTATPRARARAAVRALMAGDTSLSSP
jgi:hypothetical protein